MSYNNNSFTEDTDAQHSERAHVMANGIGEHGPDLLLTPDEIVEMEEYPEEFDTAYSIQIEENADVDAKNVELRAKFEELKAQYVACQSFIRGEMVIALKHDREYLNERFDIYGNLPTTREGVKIMVRAMLTGYDTIGVELPSVSLPPELFDTLRVLLDEYNVISEQEIREEKADKKAATVFKNIVRRRGEQMFSRLRHRAISLWGDDDPRFFEIGLVPKSAIHTPGQPEPDPGELPQLPEAPKGLNVVIWWEPSLMLLISVGPYGEHTGFDLCKAETPMGMMEPPDRPDENLVSNLPLDVEPFGDGEVVPGMKYWYWARARNGEDVGDWTGPFGIDVE